MLVRSTAMAMLLVTPAAAKPAPRPVASARATPLSPAARAMIDEFARKTAAAQAAFLALSPTEPVATSLAKRVEIEQTMRKALPDPSGLNEADRQAVGAATWGRIVPVDLANTAYLKRVLPADGWFRRSRDGEKTASDAWLIVQHSPDKDFQRAVVVRMTPLVASGEVDGRDYALLYDRTAMFAGRPQRYGSQMTCEGGRWVVATMADPANVDARRREMGLGTLAENLARFTGGC